jgi:inosine/xanthosine triphosphate pyrophosphatase family protein
MKLVSSNQNKIKEFKRILDTNLEIEEGKDLPEVDSNMDDVIIHKAKDAGPGYIVEDTILKLDGVEVVDIRWNDSYKNSNIKVATWIVSIGYNDGHDISIYRGIINGIVVKKNGISDFGFDPYFLPDGADLTLSQLEDIGSKDNFSARVQALINLNKNRPEKVISISDIKPWNGTYQH